MFYVYFLLSNHKIIFFCLLCLANTIVVFPQVVQSLGDYVSVQCHACIGGTNAALDVRKLQQGQQVVSGTPGRVLDMIKRTKLRTRAVKVTQIVKST